MTQFCTRSRKSPWARLTMKRTTWSCMRRRIAYFSWIEWRRTPARTPVRSTLIDRAIPWMMSMIIFHWWSKAVMENSSNLKAWVRRLSVWTKVSLEVSQWWRRGTRWALKMRVRWLTCPRLQRRKNTRWRWTRSQNHPTWMTLGASSDTLKELKMLIKTILKA